MQTEATKDLFAQNNAAVAPDDAPRVILNPVTHQYFHTGSDANYASVSSLLNMVKTKFDKAGKAKIVAARENRPAEEIIREWDAKADESRRKGTALHEKIEAILAQKAETEIDEKLKTLVFDALQAALTAAGVDFGFASDFASELILWHDEFEVAGTADGVYMDDDKVIIVDWKTNARIDRISPYGQKLAPPFDDIDDCNYNHYALQLSFYAFFIEENTGRTPDGLYLLHVREDWPNEGDFTIERIEVEYMRAEVLQILNAYGKPQEAKDETPPEPKSVELELLEPTHFSTSMYTGWKEMQKNAETVVANVNGGYISRASVFTQAKKIIKAAEIITEGLKKDFEAEAYKYAKTKAFNDCIISEENRNNIQYAENAEYARLEREMKIVKDLIKEATESGKAVPHPHTGELIAPVTTKPTTVVKVTIK